MQAQSFQPLLLLMLRTRPSVPVRMMQESSPQRCDVDRIKAVMIPPDPRAERVAGTAVEELLPLLLRRPIGSGKRG